MHPTVLVVLYQYNKDKVQIKFLFLSSFQPDWIHINTETKRSCQLTATFYLKKSVINQSFIVLI